VSPISTRFTYISAGSDNARPLQFVQFNNLPASPEKAQRLIGVARIAIGLEAHELASWALEEVFLMLEISSRLFCPSAFLMTTLTMATRALDQSSGTDRFPKRIRELWDDVLCTGEWNTGTDRSALVDYLCLAEYIGDNQLIGLSYFYVLINLDADDVSSELKLSSQHLQSLLFGSHALMKMGRSATVHDRVLRDPNSDNTWKPQTNSAIKDIQGRLHSMFTVKPWAR